MKDYVDSAKLQEYTTKLVTKLKTIFPGTPTAVLTAAEMTDHSKIYVYAGTETGYTAGDWYYWDGSAWASGGVYNAEAIVTDTTLSVPGMAADAEVTGKEIDGLKTPLDLRKIELVTQGAGYRVTPSATSIPDSTTATANYDCVKLTVSPGDVFSIGAYGGDNYPSYVFADGNGAIIGKAHRAGIMIKEIVVAPASAQYLIINNNKSLNTTYASYYGAALPYKTDKWIDIFQKFEGVSGIRWVDAPLHYAEYVYGANGNIIGDQPSFRRSYPIAVSAGDVVVLSCRGYSTSVAILSTCDADGNSVSVKIRSADNDVHTFTWTAASNGYIMISFYAPDPDYYTLFICSAGSATALASAVNDLTGQVTTLDGRVDALYEQRASDIVAVNPEFEVKALQAKYYKNFKPDKHAERIPLLGLLHFSDVHGSAGTITETNLERIIEFKTRYADIIDDSICTGDMVWNEWSNSFAFWTDKPGADDILTCIGNHDVADHGSYSAYGANVTMADAYAKYMAPNIADWGVVHSGSDTYYYKDYPTKKIRLIVLDYLLTGQDLTDETSWLVSTLASAVTAGYSVICAIHRMADDIVYLDCSFTSLSGYDSTLYSGGIPEAFLGAVDDYITAIGANGYFLGWLAGHTHLDYIGYSAAHPKQLNVVVCATRPNSWFDDCDRATDTRFQDACNYIAFDSEAGLVKIVRIGANRDYLMRSRNTLCIDVKGSVPVIVYND